MLTTGNKSEMATGYSTLYGDSAGGFAVIKDVPKTLVYDLCRYRNAQAVLEGLPGPIPDSVLDKAPSAELRPDQRDDQSLPPYEKLDPVLQGYVEGDQTASDLVARGFDPAVVEQVVRLVDGAEYKRRQMPPGVRITTKAFGKDRRMPITNRYRPPLAEEAKPWLRASAPATFRSIGELAELCGHYCWMERRIFELAGEPGQWPGRGRSETGDPGTGAARSPGGAQRDVGRTRLLGGAVARPPAGAGRRRCRALIVAPPGPFGEALDVIESEPDLAARVLGGLANAVPAQAWSGATAGIWPRRRRSARPRYGPFWSGPCFRRDASWSLRRAPSAPPRPGAGERARSVEDFGALVQGLLGRRSPIVSQVHGHLDTPTTMLLQPLRAESDASCTVRVSARQESIGTPTAREGFGTFWPKNVSSATTRISYVCT